MNISCESCRFYEALYKGSNTGTCHRHAPKPFATTNELGNYDWKFPMVEQSEWCGEYEKKKDEDQ